ncbi:PRD domain-containing protein [Anoxybacterium hadale]|uniref:PRD domain-containing protein n=1 Tax=Anoxybacterium hadale TaxID=3408580 RepID=A0ACD1AGT4_9FIRM|nr:PRD domain-containing protein [Clostridiales bacterium]
MVIVKILNNNFAIVKENDDKEKIIMGKGVCYGKKVGYKVEEHEIEKIFYLQDKMHVAKLEELIMKLPLEQIRLAERIINEARFKLGKKISDAIYISLADHISFSIKRFKEGFHIRNSLLWEIQRFYPDEYKVGLEALDLIEEEFAIRLPDDEAGFIALHIVNADQKNEDDNMYRVTQIMKELTNIVTYTYKKSFEVNSLSYHRFITHLRFFVQRALSNKEYTGECLDNDLFMMVKEKYKKAYGCVLKIEEYFKTECDLRITDEEKTYLSIHIERAMNSDK